MSLSNLIRKGGLSSSTDATPATMATQQITSETTVAEVATVTVAVKSCIELSSDDEVAIMTWLDYIEETDQEIIDEVLGSCRADSKARNYFLQRSKELPHTGDLVKLVSCGTCAYFKRIGHPHLGHCENDEVEAIAGLWDTDKNHCSFYKMISS